MNDSKDEWNEQLHEAWLDDRTHIISFHPIAPARLYQARGAQFWAHILSLVMCGWRVQ